MAVVKLIPQAACGAGIAQYICACGEMEMSSHREWEKDRTTQSDKCLRYQLFSLYLLEKV